MSDIAHLGHVEVYTDRFDESPDFFTRVCGLTETAPDAPSSHLRASDDCEFQALKPTRHHMTGAGQFAYHASSAEALERRVATIEASHYRTPDWEPVIWTEADRKKGQARGLKTIEIFHTHGTLLVTKEI